MVGWESTSCGSQRDILLCSPSSTANKKKWSTVRQSNFMDGGVASSWRVAVIVYVAKYLFGDKYVFSILPNQQRARSGFCLILYVLNYGRVGKYIHAKVKEI
jgi:hypothetical protein